jgi:hypothetical protein
MKFLILPLALIAGPVLACPTSADLETGIVVEDTEEFKTLYRVVDGQLQRTDFYDTGESWQSDLVFGTFWTNERTLYGGILQPEEDLTVTLEDPSVTFLRPSAGLTQSVGTRVFHADETPYVETITHVWEDLGRMSIGDCTYKSIAGRITYEAFGEPYTDMVQFLPTLGITLIIGDEYPGEEPYFYPAEDIYVLGEK